MARTDLGSQYPEERFEQRVSQLVKNVSISLVARTAQGKTVGVCFGLTDFCYWLFISDLGVDRDYVNCGIGKRLVAAAHKLAGGEKNIIMFTCANKNAADFYRKIGMGDATDFMLMNRIDWMPFTVGDVDNG